MKKNFSVFATAFFVMIFAFIISVISYADTSKGDVNLDGKISVVDAKWVLQYVTSSREFTEEQFDSADINGDGKVTVVDAKWILQIVSQLRQPPSQTSVEFATDSNTETETQTEVQTQESTQPSTESQTQPTTQPSYEPDDIPGKENYHGHVYTGGPNSKKYHYEENCAGKYSHEITWEEVELRNLEPCGTCVLK